MPEWGGDTEVLQREDGAEWNQWQSLSTQCLPGIWPSSMPGHSQGQAAPPSYGGLLHFA